MIRDMILPFVRDLLDAAGLGGVSAVTLLALLSIALYVHKAHRVGGTVTGTASTIGHDLKVVAIALAVLLVLGVVAINPDRGVELVQNGVSWVSSNVGGGVP